jgi:hypothetical protein
MNKAAAVLAENTLAQIESLIDREGDTASTQQKIGAILLDFIMHPDFRHGTDRWVLATQNDADLPHAPTRKWRFRRLESQQLPVSW